MKKLLALVMVLGMVSFANAGMVLTIDGQVAPDVIECQPSDTFVIGVLADVGLVGGELTIALSNAQGSMTYAGMESATQWVNVFIPDVYTGKTAWNFPWGVKDGTNPSPASITLDGGNFSDATILEEVLVDGIVFHCDEPTDVVMTLCGVVNGEDMGIMDSIIIHQIPEPMTMALLGLGGMALIRRRRA